MMSSYWVITCDGCGRTTLCCAPHIFDLEEMLRRQGWVIRAVDPTCIPEAACPDCVEAEL